ncbi:hypothetical protein AB0L75_44440 [Streptomyces sp. NPDC052101]|uniref:hypothetical protein n=1 Tax=Streptomyces sp. NPDC052101 TaxID=3155763 RepID=UPI00342719E8
MASSTGIVVAAAALTAVIWWALGGLWTWYAYLRPDGPVRCDGPLDPDTEFMVGQMQRVEDRVQEFIRESELEHVSLAVTGGRIGLWHEAASTRSGRGGPWPSDTSGCGPTAAPLCPTPWNTSSPICAATFSGGSKVVV